ncbi:hypothetical protein [Cohnella sp. OV330]|uniref:hypothetical protein n=1 Tax=Cohnella sp. OV330 TaxID=1855288 RepID=UPI000B7D811C|nr:hypothetical protein [Cohnella sp. OV330]
MRAKLDEELEELRFLKGAEVLNRTHPRSLPAKLRALWNYEIELPLIPVGASFAVLLVILFAAQFEEHTDQGDLAGDTPRADRQLVEAGGNTYWKDDYEKAVKSVEVKDQS